MFRTTVLLAMVAVGLMGMGAPAGGAHLGALAEAGTPVGRDNALAGVALAPFAFGVAAELPASPSGLTLLRATLDPGALLPIEADDASLALAYVEEGELTVLVGAPVSILRGVTGGMEDVAAGTEFTLIAGDSVVLPPHVAGEIRNDETTPAVALAALVEPLSAAAAATPAQ